MGEEQAVLSCELKPSEMSLWDRAGAGDAGGTTRAGCGCWEQALKLEPEYQSNVLGVLS